MRAEIRAAELLTGRRDYRRNDGADTSLRNETHVSLAGITVGLTHDGRLYEMYVNGEVRADPVQTTFLACWLNLTPGEKSAVIDYLKQKATQVRS